MQRSETLALIAMLAPITPDATLLFKLIQTSHRAYLVTPQQQFMVRRGCRRLHCANKQYWWMLPNGRCDGPFIYICRRDTKIYCVTGYYRIGEICGRYSLWYNPTQLHSRFIYVNGQRHGDALKWYTSGQLRMRCTYVNGRRHGEKRRWYITEQPLSRCDYVEGLVHGECLFWYTSGQLYKQYGYSNGKMHGECLTWYTDGQLNVQCTYNTGSPRGTYRSWFESGRIYEQYDHDDAGHIHGVLTQWCTAEQTYKQYNYVNGVNCSSNKPQYPGLHTVVKP